MIDRPFQPFAKIARLRRQTIVTEKIDGTNAGIFINDTCDELVAAKRSGWITPESDNYGFAAWVRDHADELRGLGPGMHWGEWWGKGINRRPYGIEGKRFSLFNVDRWSTATPPPCCHVVPLLAVFDTFDTAGIERTLETLKRTGSIAAPRCMVPEGIVAFHVASRTCFKITCEKDNEYKGQLT